VVDDVFMPLSHSLMHFHSSHEDRFVQVTGNKYAQLNPPKR